MVMRLLHILFISCALAVMSAAAQTPPRVPVVPKNLLDNVLPPFPTHDANETREALQRLLQQYPPSLGQVLRLDPSLLTNEEYLAPYPNLAAFLTQHPEVAHNPVYFVGNPDYSEDRYTPAMRRSENAMAGVAALFVMLTAVSVLCWIIKIVIDQRRWQRVSKVQSEVHSKLLDRFTSNQDLLAYIETPAGRRFLESAPISIDSASHSVSAPLGRILFSVQAGIVLALAGSGLYMASERLAEKDLAEPLFVLALLAGAVGVGLLISGLVAYIMSRRLGLLNPTPLPSASDSAGASPPNA
jgi:hypothetical protein